MSRAETIREAVERRADGMRELLEALVLAESPSTDPASQEPVFDLLVERLDPLGFEVRRHMGERTGGQIEARPSGGDPGRPVQLVLGHVDTVWPHGTLETMPLVVEDGILRGPGSFDMKGGLAQLVLALQALRVVGEEPELAPVVFVNSDEEIGSPESEGRIRTLAQEARRAIVLEPALGLDGRIKTSRRGTGRFEIRVVGKGAHAGLAPEEGASAIQELSHVIQRLHELTDRERGVEVTVGQVRGGVRPNVVAPEASAVVDVRVRAAEDGAWIEERIHGLTARTPGTRLEIEGAVGRAPLEPTPRNQALWRAVKEAGRELGLELEQGMSGGASDGNLTSEYTATIDGLGCVGDGAHAQHEFVDLDRTVERAALLARVLLLPETRP